MWTFKRLAQELVKLDALPAEPRRQVAGAVAFTLREHEQCLLDHSSGALTEEEAEAVNHVPEWKIKVRRRFYLLHRALALAELHDDTRLDRGVKENPSSSSI
jgi:hypothetical protein